MFLLTKRLATITLLVFLAMIGSVSSFSTTPSSTARRDETKLRATMSRQRLLHNFMTGMPPVAAALLLVSSSTTANAMPPQKSYSTNAKNFDRLNAGDSSGGSVYDNNPSAPAARRRRAMQGCKVGSARTEAGRILGQPKFSEKDCVSTIVAHCFVLFGWVVVQQRLSK